MAKGEKDSIEDRLWMIQDKSLEEEALVECFKAVEKLIDAIQSEAISFNAFAQEMRTQERRGIVERHQRSQGLASRIATSKRVLFLRFENGRPRFTWHVVWYSERGPKPRFTSLKSNKSGTALRDVLEGAHPDEIDLLMQHEMTVRDFNARWSHIATIRRAVRMFALATIHAREKRAQPAEQAE